MTDLLFNKSKEELIHKIHSLQIENDELRLGISRIGNNNDSNQLTSDSQYLLIQTILKESPIIVFSINSEGVFTYSEGKGLSRLGLLPGQVVGLSAYDVYHDNQTIIQQIKQSLQGKEIHAILHVNDLYFEILYQPIITKDIVTGVVGFAIDVTNQKYAELDRDRFFETTLAMLCTADMQGFFTRLNPAWTKTLGYTNEELMAQPFLNLVHPDDLQSTLDEISNLSNGYTTINFINRYRCKEGNYKWLNWVSVPYGNRIYASALDITEMKNNEEKLNVLLQELKQSNEELEQFAYVSSHDLQEPLRKIKNYGELLEAKYKENLTDEAKHYLNIITNGALRMQNLINDLLSFSRITSQANEFKLTDFNVVVATVIDNLEYIIVKNNAQIVIPQSLPVLKADKSQIEQVFQNLISNAIKFKSDNLPTIIIEAIDTDTHWTFKITDNGIGLNMEYAEKIFVVFQRLHSQLEYQGTGIGLAICKKIVERHNGTIWVESKLGNGCVFYFTIMKQA